MDMGLVRHEDIRYLFVTPMQDCDGHSVHAGRLAGGLSSFTVIAYYLSLVLV